MSDLTIATEVTTGALVITAGRRGRALKRLRRGVASAIAQRPAAVVLDLSQAPSWCVPAALAAGLGRFRRGVPVIATVPRRMRALSLMPGVTTAPLPRVLARLPGFRLAADRVCARFHPDLAAAGQARALVSEAAAHWQVEHLAASAQLIASELVSNAVEHAGTDVYFQLLRMRHGLCIAVRDDDPRPPRLSARESRLTRGRGLAIVARTAHRWGCLVGTADKIVWAALRDTMGRPARAGSAHLSAA